MPLQTLLPPPREEHRVRSDKDGGCSETEAEHIDGLEMKSTQTCVTSSPCLDGQFFSILYYNYYLTHTHTHAVSTHALVSDPTNASDDETSSGGGRCEVIWLEHPIYIKVPNSSRG